MLLGMTAAEWGLAAFIFAIVYLAGYVGRFGELVGAKLGREAPEPEHVAPALEPRAGRED